MNKIFLILILFYISLLSIFAQDKVTCPIIPLPQLVKDVQSEFRLSDKTIIIHDLQSSEIAHYLQKEMLRYRDIPLKLILNDDRVELPTSNVIHLSHRPLSKNLDINGETYLMKMNNSKIEIESFTSHGLFNGVVSLIQLVRLSESIDDDFVFNVPCFNIEDTPKYVWRGLMLDESRHFFGKDKVKQLIDWMAFYKLNRFHWHLTDEPGWRIEIKKYPKLALVGGIGSYTDPYISATYYTQEDIKEIVSYASERFIEIIPEIEMPGHAAAANRAYPEFSGGGSKRLPDFTFNPGKEKLYSYLTDILKEVDALFPSQIIHIGADEVSYGNENWPTDNEIKMLMKRENLKDLKEVEKYFVRRMSDSLRVLNNKTAAWDEVVDYGLPIENTIIYYWRSRLPEQLQKIIDNEYPIVFCPNQVFYLDYKQDSTHLVGFTKYVNTINTIYNFSPYSLPVNYKENTNILGIQANIWTEMIVTNERLDYMTFPRLAALAETTWNDVSNKDYEKFTKRLNKHIDLYRLNDLYFYNPFEPDENKEPKK